MPRARGDNERAPVEALRRPRSARGRNAQANPGIFNDLNRKNKSVGSLDAKVLKPEEPNLCEFCNSTLTQPYDRAWEELATALRARPARGGADLHLNRLLRHETHKKLLGVHLWLVKKMGCTLIDAGRRLPNPLDLFDEKTVFLSDALLSGKACPYLYTTLFPPRMLGQQGRGR